MLRSQGMVQFYQLNDCNLWFVLDQHMQVIKDKVLMNTTQLHHTDNIRLLSCAKLLSLGLSF